MNPLLFTLILASALLHAVWNFAAKRAAGNLEVIWLGLVTASFLCAPVALTIPFPMAGLPYVAATGALHALYFRLIAKGYEAGEISVIYPIARGTGVAGTALAGVFFLREVVSVPGAAGIMAVAVGTCLIGARPNGAGGVQGIVTALCIGATMACYSLVDKLGVAIVHPVVYVWGIFLVAALLLSPHVLLTRRARIRDAWCAMGRLAVLIGCSSMATYLLILYAFRLGPVSYIVALREFAVVIGAFLGIRVLGETLTVRKGLGIASIVAGLVLIKIG